MNWNSMFNTEHLYSRVYKTKWVGLGKSQFRTCYIFLIHLLNQLKLLYLQLYLAPDQPDNVHYSIYNYVYV